MHIVAVTVRTVDGEEVTIWIGSVCVVLRHYNEDEKSTDKVPQSIRLEWSCYMMYL
jgi:hypothetical protein